MDEALRERAREFGLEWVKQHPNQPKTYTNGNWSDEAMVEFAVALASIVQAEARAQGMREAAEIARYYESDGDLTQADIATGIAAAIEQAIETKKEG